MSAATAKRFKHERTLVMINPSLSGGVLFLAPFATCWDPIAFALLGMRLHATSKLRLCLPRSAHSWQACTPGTAPRVGTVLMLKLSSQLLPYIACRPLLAADLRGHPLSSLEDDDSSLPCSPAAPLDRRLGLVLWGSAQVGEPLPRSIHHRCHQCGRAQRCSGLNADGKDCVRMAAAQL
jgi:hypothetical protein